MTSDTKLISLKTAAKMLGVSPRHFCDRFAIPKKIEIIPIKGTRFTALFFRLRDIEDELKRRSGSL